MSEIDLSAQDNIAIINYEDFKIETVDQSIEYSEFFENFMKRNLPCIIKNITENWECTTKWLVNDTINYDHFICEYGDLEAPVADCRNTAYNAHCKVNMTVSNYMNYLKNKTDKLLYLKDWHLRRLRPMDNFYKVPGIFSSDWLNEFTKDEQDDDYMFVYIGPKDSWTPLHADVFSSYSWSVNVVGCKKWILFPPGKENQLKDKLGNLPMFFHKEVFKDAKYFEIIQEKGDAVFIPSGWFHQVINIFDTISINHNWINACNIEKVWHALQANLISVENEIDEFRNTEDFESHCQLMLKSVFGMDFEMFIRFICHIGNKRLEQLQSENHIEIGKHILGLENIKFDLIVVLRLMKMISDHYILINKNVIPLELQNHFFTLKQTIIEKI